MPVKHGVLPFVAALAALAIPGCATTPVGPAEWDGLVRQHGTRFDAVFLKPDAEIASYSDIILAPASVQFARNWNPDRGGRSLSRRLNSADILAIQDNLAAMVAEIFREELTTGGHQIVTEAGPDTLLVIPAIMDLYITAPDTAGAGVSRTYTANPGRMTLVLEVRDSVTGETLGRVVDGRSARNTDMMTITNRVTNTADARRIIRGWAQALRSGLDSVAGCCRVDQAVAASTMRDVLEGPTWLLTELPGLERTWRERMSRPVSLRFVDGQVSGFSGCNTFFGGYERDGDRLVLGQLASTMMACDEPKSDIERRFQDAFKGTLQYFVEGEQVRFVGASGDSLLFVAEPPARLDGVTWVVTGYNNGRGAVVSVMEGATISMQFGDADVTGSSGCNTFRASYTMDGTTIEFGHAMTTRRACEEPLMTQEREFLAALASSVRWTIVDGVLDMHRADSERTIRAARQ